ncbi:MAG: sugar-binding domain-containing protein [Pseudomonadota bacterium]
MGDAELAARAAWLHFVGGLTQSEVARRLDVPTTRAHRYIARAQQDGLVRVFVDVESADCVKLEMLLATHYGLKTCRVAMEIPEAGPLPLRALSALGGDVLMRTVAAGEHSVIGVGNGRTLAASVAAMGRVPAAATRFVSMLGGLTRSGAANPYDVIHSLAQKTGAEAYLMPAPLFADTARDKKVMMSQAALGVTMELIAKASLVVVGIGNLDPDGATTTAMGSAPEVAALKRDGARAEILGQFLGADGRVLHTPCDARVMAPALENLRGREMIAIAGGIGKAGAILAALKSGLLTGLIIDEATARSLVDELGLAVAA